MDRHLWAGERKIWREHQASGHSIVRADPTDLLSSALLLQDHVPRKEPVTFPLVQHQELVLFTGDVSVKSSFPTEKAPDPLCTGGGPIALRVAG